MNQVATRGGSTAVAALSSLKAGLQNVQQTLIKKGGDPFLRLGRDGIWIYGADDTEVEEGSIWAANPLSLMHGYVAWERGDKADNSGGPLGEIMVPASQPLPIKHELKDVGADWQQQFSIMLKCINLSDAGEQVLYKTASVGGIAAFDDLINAILAQADKGTDQIVPLIDLQVDSYKHAKYGKTFTPILKITGWATLNGVVDEPDWEAEELPADPAPEPEVTQAAPARRTRTRSVPATEPAKPAAEAASTPAEPSAADKLAAMEAEIARLKAAAAGQTAPAAGEPMRRRRNPA